MKTLIFNKQEFKADKIIKTETDIIGEDSNGNEVFALRGISDFSGFTLEEGQVFDTVEPSEQEVLNAQLLKENADIKAQLQSQQELNAQLLLDIATLKGGSTNV